MTGHKNDKFLKDANEVSLQMINNDINSIKSIIKIMKEREENITKCIYLAAAC